MNIPVPEISLVCSARTDCSIFFPVGVLGICSLSRLLPFSIFARCHSSLVPAWQRGSNTGSFVTVQAVLHGSNITLAPAYPRDAGNSSISTGDTLIKVATYHQTETLGEAAGSFVRPS